MTHLDSTRKKILESAGKLFADSGYAKVSIREICTLAGANVAAVNYHFGDKQRLYIEAVRQARTTRAQAVPLPEWSSENTAEEKLRGVILTLLRRLNGWEEAPWQVRLMMREVLFPTEACRELVEEYFRPFVEMLLCVIDEFFEEPLETAVRFKMGFSVIGQVLFYRITSANLPMLVGQDRLEREFDIESLANHISLFAIGGLKQFNQLHDGASKHGRALRHDSASKHVRGSTETST